MYELHAVFITESGEGDIQTVRDRDRTESAKARGLTQRQGGERRMGETDRHTNTEKERERERERDGERQSVCVCVCVYVSVSVSARA